MPLPKGAGKQVDIAAAKLIQKLGKERLPEFVKLHFANTEGISLIKIVSTKTGAYKLLFCFIYCPYSFVIIIIYRLF